jgi:hypothetical protein
MQAELLLREATNAALGVAAMLHCTSGHRLHSTPAAVPRHTFITKDTPSTEHILSKEPQGESLRRSALQSEAASTSREEEYQEVALLIHLLRCVLELGVKEDWRHVAAIRPREAVFVAARAVQQAAPSAAVMLQVGIITQSESFKHLLWGPRARSD